MSSLSEPRSLPSFGAMASILTAFGNIAAATRAGHEYEALSRLSDFELERRGLKREDLPGYVFDRHLR